MMVELSEIDAAGNRTGSFDRLHANAMTVGSKVAHDRVKGTCEIAEVIQSDAGGGNQAEVVPKVHQHGPALGVA